jgi:phage terminase large subunit-like protein
MLDAPPQADPRLVMPSTGDEWVDLLRMIPGYDPFAGVDPEVYHFDAESAAAAIRFYHDELTHPDGVMAGKPFILERWQQAIIANLFGWKREKGGLRYRKVFDFEPRKNGKSPKVAGIALYFLARIGERGAPIFVAAADIGQASLIYGYADGMVKNNERLSEQLTVYKGRRHIVNESTMAALKVLSSEAKTKHGLTPSLVIIDELHAQPNRELVDTLTTANASLNRENPMTIFTTTADYDHPSICNEEYAYACKVRDGEIENLTYLPIIYEAGPDDDWTDPKTWAKANPNLGISVSEDFLRQECEDAKSNPAKENTFRRLHLNQKTNTNVVWMALRYWDQTSGAEPGETPEAWRARKLEEMKGRACCLGVDLSHSGDITAVVGLFPPDEPEKPWTVIPWFWVPTTNAQKREKDDRVPYIAWSRRGFLTLTGDDYVDYGFVAAHIGWCHDYFDVREVGFDPWNARAPAQDWEKRFAAKVVEVRQGAATLSEPMKRVYGLALAERLHHGGNPVLRWMIGNTSAKVDENENIRPDKDKSTERIDGVTAMITGMARAMVMPPATRSVYEKRGLIRL